MQKNSITNKITPCCGLPFSVIYWWVSNLTLNSESDRQYLLTQISQNGVLSIDGWKVLVNSGTLEADASLTKTEFLAWFDCEKQPSCEQLKLIIEGYKMGNWVGDLNEIRFENVLGVLKISDSAPTTQGLYILSDIGVYTNLGGIVTTEEKINYAYFDGTTWSLIAVDLPQPIVNNVTNNNSYTVDPEQIVPSESLYNDNVLAGDITKRISVHSKKEVTYKEVTVNENGVAISDDDLDDTKFYIKVGSKYYQQVISGEINVEDFGILPNGTDQTQNINKLLQRIRKTGGTLVFGVGTYKIDGQIVIPDNGFKTSSDAYAQNSITIRGAGGWHSGQQQQQYPVIGGTVLKMAFQSTDYFQAKIVTRGLGRFTLRDLTIYSTVATDTTPMFMTTMTTVHIVGVSFRGAQPASGNPNIDAIILGGTRKAVSGVETGYDDPNFAFQGYGSVIERCYFDYVDKVAYMRSYANHIVFRDNFVEKTCGTNKVNGSCIEVDGSLDVTNSQSGDYTTGVQILNNYINGLGYYYQVVLRKATRCLIMGNGSPDPQPNLIALVGILDVVENGVTYGSVDNYVIANHCQEAKHTEIETSSIRNTVIGTYGETERNIFGTPVNMKGGSIANPNLLGNTIANRFFRFKNDLYLASDSVYEAYRSANAPTNPNALIYRLLINGSQDIAGSGSGNRYFYDEDGTTLRSAFENRGTKWRAVGQSGMTIDVGPINSFLDVLAYGSRFSDQNGGPLRVKIGGTGRDSISFGANSELTIERATSANVFAVNAPIKSANYTTSSRPSASVCGIGTMIYDIDLKKPLWSDGSEWKDATGTAV